MFTNTNYYFGNVGTVNIEIIVPLKYLINFWRTLQMLLINSKTNLTLSGSTNCVICKVEKAKMFTITDTKIYTTVKTLSTQDITGLLQKLELGFKHTFNRNKY